ncbi:MAG TPA: hypothetical protein DD734_03565 [Firmicutes bacterium]|nr:hypothetical protein [Bacillota bacterium]
MLPVRNHFFGEEVTVTGLVTGEDIRCTLEQTKLPAGTCLLLPRVMLRHRENIFLDGMTVDELRALTPFPLKVIDVNGEEVVKTLFS